MPDFKPTWRQRKDLAKMNRKFPLHLVRIPQDDWVVPGSFMKNPPIEVWRSRNFLVQVFAVEDGIERLTVCRTSVQRGKWAEGVSWDDLQRLKGQCGRGDKCAVELYPPDANVVNVDNMRHLFVLPESPSFMW